MSINANVGQKHRINPNSLLNLREPWEPGKSANPGGQRKGQVYVSECYKRLILLTPDEIETYAPVNVAEKIALTQVKNALADKEPLLALPSTKEITDRTEGKAPQRVEISKAPEGTDELLDRVRLQMIAEFPGADPALVERTVQEEFERLEAKRVG